MSKNLGFAQGVASMRGLETNRTTTSNVARETATVDVPGISKRKPKGSGPRRVPGLVNMTVWVEEEVRKELNKLGIETDKTQATLMVEAINLLFQQYDKSPIAKR